MWGVVAIPHFFCFKRILLAEANSYPPCKRKRLKSAKKWLIFNLSK